MSKKVIVGMSGGVDSSVAAFLLKKKGFEVECLFMKNWEDDEHCPAEEDYNDALQVCNSLNLPLHSVNFSREYQVRVFDDFLDKYRSGRTPNPDVFCNKEIKFKVFLDYALELGANFIVTGHYARIKHYGDRFHLLKGKDIKKDQSYFLYLLGQKELEHSLFPLGEMNKAEVRRLAKNAHLKTYKKKDSTGICFIGEQNFNQFLKKYIKPKPGDIVTINGELTGSHDGLMYYTIGQRKGIGVGGGFGKKEAPWYVAEKDLVKNQLIIVQGNDHPALYSKILKAVDLHWIHSIPKNGSNSITAKIRYRQNDQNCSLVFDKQNSVHVQFEKDQFAVTPGQSIVFYEGDECLGGGIIESRVCS